MLRKSKITQSLTLMIVLVSMLTLSWPAAQAQKFDVGATGKYSVGGAAGNNNTTSRKDRGIIRMKGSATGENTNGSIEGIGSTDATRIPGTVIWAKTTEAQNVQPLFYTSLGVQNTGDKFFGANTSWTTTTGSGAYYVSYEFLRYGNLTIPTPLTNPQALSLKSIPGGMPYNYNTSVTVPSGVTEIARIVHECESEFWYDGNVAQQMLGSIDVTGAGAYKDNVYSLVRTYNATDVTAIAYTQMSVLQQMANSGAHTVTTKTVGPFLVNPNAVWNLTFDASCATDLADKGGDTTKIDTVKIDDDCTKIPAGSDIVCRPDPPVTPPTDCPECEPDPCENAAIQWRDNVIVRIDGDQTIGWHEGDPDALLPICMYAGEDCIVDPTKEPTRVVYATNATKVFPAYYGIIEFEQGAHNITLGGNVYIKGKRSYALDFRGIGTVSTFAYDANATNRGYDPGNTNPYKIVFTDICADATYANCNSEVVGWIYRSKSDATNPHYTYHNQKTNITFGTVPVAGDGDHWFGLLSVPGYEVGTGASHAEATSAADLAAGYGYVNRLWEVSFIGEGNIAEFSMGYTQSDLPTAWTGSLADANASWKKSMRGYEAFLNGSTPTNGVFAPGENGVAVPFGWNWDNSTCQLMAGYRTGGTIFLTSTGAPGDVAGETVPYDLSPGSQFAFGNKPLIFVSQRNGRWSDPGTWRQNTTPTSVDIVKLAHKVYTGLYDHDITNATTLFGNQQWSTNEYDLPGVLTVSNKAVLADTVYILNQTDANAITQSTNQSGALIVGNYETAGESSDNSNENSTNPGLAMDFTQALLFGTIYAQGSATGYTPASNLDISDVKTLPATWAFSGLWIMGTGTNNTNAGIINPNDLLLSGEFINEGILELGHDEK